MVSGVFVGRMPASSSSSSSSSNSSSSSSSSSNSSSSAAEKEESEEQVFCLGRDMHAEWLRMKGRGRRKNMIE